MKAEIDFRQADFADELKMLVIIDVVSVELKRVVS